MTANKVWLNKRHDEHGSLTWSVEGRVSYKDKKIVKGRKDCELRLTDCYKTIVLDFSYSDREGFEERVAKMSTLMAELTTFQQLLNISYTEPDDDSEEEASHSLAPLDLEELLGDA